MANRTANPIRATDIGLYSELKAQLGETRRAVLGNASGQTRAPNNTDVTGDISGWGYYLARWVVGVDEDGNATLGEVFRVRQGNVHFPTNPGTVIYVKKDLPSGVFVVVGYDDKSLISAGIDPRQFNTGDAANKQIVFRHLQNGRTKTHTQTTGSETKITVQDLLYIWDGTAKNAVKGLSGATDLASYITATTTDESLIAIGLQPEDNTIAVVSTNQTITTNSITMAQITTLLDGFDDYVLPLELYRVPSGTTALKPSHRELGADLRQIVNVQQPRGFPISISRHIKVVDNYRVTTSGTHTIAATGQLEIAATGQLVSL